MLLVSGALSGVELDQELEQLWEYEWVLQFWENQLETKLVQSSEQQLELQWE